MATGTNMRCTKCGAENPQGLKFCNECAAPFGRRCGKCGFENAATAKFCGECAAPIDASAAPKPAVSPRNYTPKHLADKILTSRAVLEGERKQVTVLFADVKGSMELAEQLDAEEWSQIMNRFFQILSDSVERFEGFVDKFTGDGIMALFGAPVAHEDHARRACYAALHMVDGLRGYANELRLRRGLNFSARLGLNSGEVIVAKIGDDLAHGLHRAGPHRRSRVPHGTDRRTGQGVPHGARRGPNTGVLRGLRSGRDGDQRSARG